MTANLNRQIKNILISDDINQKCVDILANNGLAVTKKINLTNDLLLEEIKVKFFCFKYKIQNLKKNQLM
jgi:hypothetical protein